MKREEREDPTTDLRRIETGQLLMMNLVMKAGGDHDDERWFNDHDEKMDAPGCVGILNTDSSHQLLSSGILLSFSPYHDV